MNLNDLDLNITLANNGFLAESISLSMVTARQVHFTLFEPCSIIGDPHEK